MKRRLGALVGAVALAGALFTACVDPARPTNRGYLGTWSRGNDKTVSILAITKRDGRYLFRWTKHSFVDDFSVRCDWGGRCEEHSGGTLTATYVIEPRLDPATGILYTDTVEHRLVPEDRTYRYTDRLKVLDGGMTLGAYTVERDGQTFTVPGAPQRFFAKVSDSVAYPPRGRSR